MNLDRRLLKQIGILKTPLILAVLGGFLAGIATVFQARQVSQVVARVFLGGQDLAAVMPLMGLLLVFLAARAALTYLSEVAASAAARRVKEHLREALARHLMALGPAYTQGERSGELVNTLTQGVEALDAYFSQYLPQLALAGLLPLAYLAVVFPLDPLSGAILLLTGPLIPVFMFLIGSTAERLTQKQFGALGRMSAYFLDTLQGLATLKMLGRSQEQAERIAAVGEQYRAATMSVLRVTFLSALALELLSTMGTAIIAVEIGLRLLYGRMAFENAFFLLLLAPDFYLPLRNLGLRFHASMAGVSAARRIFAVLETGAREPADHPSSSDSRRAGRNARQLPSGSQAVGEDTRPTASATPAVPQVVSLRDPFTIEFSNVHFTYPSGGATRPAALNGVSLRITSGQTVALVGPSGAGKSTIAGLLLRFYAPERGSILVNNVPLETIPADRWRAQTAWVPQQPYLFYGSLADNLRVAKPGASKTELRQAAEQAHLLAFIDALPQGLDTPVGESGARLSGGQAQRLALARAFLRDAPFLILDEPTAHLDVEQERLLRESIRRLCAGRTVLVIAHRLPTVAGADQIVVLEDGRVIETGRHAELLERRGGAGTGEDGKMGAYARLLAAYQGREP